MKYNIKCRTLNGDEEIIVQGSQWVYFSVEKEKKILTFSSFTLRRARLMGEIIFEYFYVSVYIVYTCMEFAIKY